ncbi:hypothetical protein ACH4LN_18165 [Streptomyces albus]|uniref:hypothetical protein n=1 Tax=Streptomyces TaxID=1883 RepID=UPI0004BE58E8|nr:MULTISPECIES: hypothetical protein [Streptomyces]GHJ21690.1 hypothetical protein TPA0909_33040 [Streptomyces albus]
MLSVQFTRAGLSIDEPVRVTETRGHITYELHSGLFLPEGVAALNSATRAILAGGQWFQLWKGEIISMETPELEARHAGIHRGPLVDQEAGPRHR